VSGGVEICRPPSSGWPTVHPEERGYFFKTSFISPLPEKCDASQSQIQQQSRLNRIADTLSRNISESTSTFNLDLQVTKYTGSPPVPQYCVRNKALLFPPPPILKSRLANELPVQLPARMYKLADGEQVPCAQIEIGTVPPLRLSVDGI